MPQGCFFVYLLTFFRHCGIFIAEVCEAAITIESRNIRHVALREVLEAASLFYLIVRSVVAVISPAGVVNAVINVFTCAL